MLNFEDIYEEITNIVSLAVYKFKNRLKADKEDLEQELLIKIFNNLDKIEDVKNRNKNWKGYIYGMCCNCLKELELKEHYQGLWITGAYEDYMTGTDSCFDIVDSFIVQYRKRKNNSSKKYYQENKEKIKIRRLNYYNEHEEEVKEYRKQYNKKYKQEHKKEIQQYNKKYNEEHSDYFKQYYQAHKGYFKQYYQEHKEDAKRYYQEHKEEIKEKQRQRRQQLKEQKLEEMIIPIPSKIEQEMIVNKLDLLLNVVDSMGGGLC